MHLVVQRVPQTGGQFKGFLLIGWKLSQSTAKKRSKF
jgi:hypothetical protein